MADRAWAILVILVGLALAVWLGAFGAPGVGRLLFGQDSPQAELREARDNYQEQEARHRRYPGSEQLEPGETIAFTSEREAAQSWESIEPGLQQSIADAEQRVSVNRWMTIGLRGIGALVGLGAAGLGVYMLVAKAPKRREGLASQAIRNRRASAGGMDRPGTARPGARPVPGASSRVAKPPAAARPPAGQAGKTPVVKPAGSPGSTGSAGPARPAGATGQPPLGAGFGRPLVGGADDDRPRQLRSFRRAAAPGSGARPSPALGKGRRPPRPPTPPAEGDATSSAAAGPATSPPVGQTPGPTPVDRPATAGPGPQEPAAPSPQRAPPSPSPGTRPPAPPASGARPPGAATAEPPTEAPRRPAPPLEPPGPRKPPEPQR